MFVEISFIAKTYDSIKLFYVFFFFQETINFIFNNINKQEISLLQLQFLPSNLQPREYSSLLHPLLRFQQTEFELLETWYTSSTKRFYCLFN